VGFDYITRGRWGKRKRLWIIKIEGRRRSRTISENPTILHFFEGRLGALGPASTYPWEGGLGQRGRVPDSSIPAVGVPEKESFTKNIRGREVGHKQGVKKDRWLGIRGLDRK